MVRLGFWAVFGQLGPLHAHTIDACLCPKAAASADARGATAERDDARANLSVERRRTGTQATQLINVRAELDLNHITVLALETELNDFRIAARGTNPDAASRDRAAAAAGNDSQPSPAISPARAASGGGGGGGGDPPPPFGHPPFPPFAARHRQPTALPLQQLPHSAVDNEPAAATNEELTMIGESLVLDHAVERAKLQALVTELAAALQQMEAKLSGARVALEAECVRADAAEVDTRKVAAHAAGLEAELAEAHARTAAVADRLVEAAELKREVEASLRSIVASSTESSSNHDGSNDRGGGSGDGSGGGSANIGLSYETPARALRAGMQEMHDQTRDAFESNSALLSEIAALKRQVRTLKSLNTESENQLAAAEIKFQDEHKQYNDLLAAGAAERGKLDRTQEALNALSASLVDEANELNTSSSSSTNTAAGDVE